MRKIRQTTYFNQLLALLITAVLVLGTGLFALAESGDDASALGDENPAATLEEESQTDGTFETGDPAADTESAEAAEEPEGEAPADGTDPAAKEPAEDPAEDAAPALFAAPAADGDPAATPAEDPLDGCDFKVTGEAANYAFDKTTGVLTITGDVTVAMKGGVTETAQRIVVAGNAAVTVQDLSIKAAGGPAVRINPGVTATLTMAGSSTVTGAANYAGIEVGYVWNSDGTSLADLTIGGSGALTANGGNNSAGIGGSYSGTNGEKTAVYYGNITIAADAGTITANGNNNGAGIGSSGNNGGSAGSFKVDQQGWGTITINGGTIKANGGKGGNGGAGIGGGNHVDSGQIVINGGTITAEGSAGIGSGFGSSKNKGNNDDKGPGYYYATVEIHGGTIHAAGRAYGGAGIGGSAYGDAHVVITDGNITAIGGGGSNYHHGAAGIGGGYIGDAIVEISGGTIVATGGCAGAGIGSGGTPNANEDRAETGRSTEDGVTYVTGGTTVTITGGNITATGGEKGGAGIGSGVGAEKVTVTVTGGTVRAAGAKSSEEDKKGGAGIGSGYYGRSSPDKDMYFVKTETHVTVTGGDVLAVGGWGASGIGSGAENQMAKTITIDAEKADIEAYADGTMFAIDTRDVTGDGGDGTTTTSHTEGRDITGSVLQGTFVHVYTSEDDVEQGTEGLSSIQVINDRTGDFKELTQMPEGYRSFATNVSEAGTYSVYSDAEEIAEGGGRYFNKCNDEKRSDEDVQTAKDVEERNVQYQAKDGEICDNFYLFPVKTIVVTKAVEAEESILDGIDHTLYFGLWNDAEGIQDYVRIKEDGEISYDKTDEIWIESIEVKDGEPQGTVTFAGIDEGVYAVSELDLNRQGKEDMRMQPGTPIAEDSPISIVKIKTRHGEGDDNDAVISDQVWTDRVTVVNTYEKTASKLKLQIRKVMPQYYNAGEAANATAVFKVTVLGDAAEDGASPEPLYENYFSLLFNKAGEQETEEVEISNLSGAKTLVVEEVYSAGYDAAAEKGEGAVRTIDLTDPDLDTEEPIEVSFTNTFNPAHPVFGSGLLNRYHDKTYVDQDAPGPQVQ